MSIDFTIFICTHGRPDTQYTLDMLRHCGYTGKIWLVLDDTDSTIQQYIDNYGAENILIFDKNYFINDSDTGTDKLFDKCILYAKNAVEYVANYWGLKYFAIADDDIKNLCVRYIDGDKLRRFNIDTNFDLYLQGYLDFLESTNMAAVGFGTANSYFSGVDTFSFSSLDKLRIVYQFVIRSIRYDIKWRSFMNEDSVTSILHSNWGQYMLINPSIMQTTTVIGETSDAGGMHETYQVNNSLRRCLITMIFAPNCIHPYKYKGSYVLKIDRANAFPKIISGAYKK